MNYVRSSRDCPFPAEPLQEDITNLLIDCTIVYVKSRDRSKAPLKPKDVRPVVAPAASWIIKNFVSVEREKFVSDKHYFPEILEQYQHSLRR